MTKTPTPPAGREVQRSARENDRQDAVHRILNLLFILNASRIPLTTSQILDDEELGYSAAKRESAMKQFKRDRQKLESLGIVVAEVKERGASEREESSWAIDQERTHAVPRLITADDADLLAKALTDHLLSPGLPYRRPLERIVAKLTSARGLTPPDLPGLPDASQDNVLEAVWTAFSLRLKLTFEYENARGEATKRTVCVYGLFSVKGVSYLAGLDEKSSQVRTFRIDRIQRVWKPKGTYAIPADFDVTDFLFFRLCSPGRNRSGHPWQGDARAPRRRRALGYRRARPRRCRRLLPGTLPDGHDAPGAPVPYRLLAQSYLKGGASPCLENQLYTAMPLLAPASSCCSC